MKQTSLMTQYLEGVLASRDLQDMLNEYAAQARFDRELHEENALSPAAKKPYGHSGARTFDTADAYDTLEFN